MYFNTMYPTKAPGDSRSKGGRLRLSYFVDYLIEGTIKKSWELKANYFADIKLRRCTNKEILPKSTYLFVRKALCLQNKVALKLQTS